VGGWVGVESFTVVDICTHTRESVGLKVRVDGWGGVEGCTVVDTSTRTRESECI